MQINTLTTQYTYLIHASVKDVFRSRAHFWVLAMLFTIYIYNSFQNLCVVRFFLFCSFLDFNRSLVIVMINCLQYCGYIISQTTKHNIAIKTHKELLRHVAFWSLDTHPSQCANYSYPDGQTPLLSSHHRRWYFYNSSSLFGQELFRLTEYSSKIQ